MDAFGCLIVLLQAAAFVTEQFEAFAESFDQVWMNKNLEFESKMHFV